mmetsp:Transcript_57194/g.159178  ORF Transcript_57194/g.159178 Transcript_57194/m.159178 type:complete len:308 (+) Transcript_57194:540-1463(+)
MGTRPNPSRRASFVSSDVSEVLTSLATKLVLSTTACSMPVLHFVRGCRSLRGTSAAFVFVDSIAGATLVAAEGFLVPEHGAVVATCAIHGAKSFGAVGLASGRIAESRGAVSVADIDNSWGLDVVTLLCVARGSAVAAFTSGILSWRFDCGDAALLLCLEASGSGVPSSDLLAAGCAAPGNDALCGLEDSDAPAGLATALTKSGVCTKRDTHVPCDALLCANGFNAETDGAAAGKEVSALRDSKASCFATCFVSGFLESTETCAVAGMANPWASTIVAADAAAARGTASSGATSVFASKFLFSTVDT